MSDKKIIIALGVVLFILGAAIVSMRFSSYFTGIIHTEPTTLDGYATQIVKQCASAPYRPTCYEDEVPKLEGKIPMEQIFDVIRLIRKKDPQYLFCHVLAHKLGSYEVSLDPQNWLDAIAKGPTDGLCSNGFAHGAIVTRFHDEKLSVDEFHYALKDIAIACEPRAGWDPTDLTKAICYHGIGHVLVHMTQADIPESLEGCETVALKDDGRDYRQLCTEGIYMQLFQPLEPEDYALIDRLSFKPTHDNIQDFCSTNSKTVSEYGACWREAWPLLGQSVYDPHTIEQYCGELTDAGQQNLCFITFVTINGRQNLGAPDKMALTCNGLSKQYQGMCFSRGANAFLEEDQTLASNAIDMCSRAQSSAVQDECYGFLAGIASFNFHPGSPAFEALCSALPEKWLSTCEGNR